MRPASAMRSSEIFIFKDTKTVILASGSRPCWCVIFLIDVYVFFFFHFDTFLWHLQLNNDLIKMSPVDDVSTQH